MKKLLITRTLTAALAAAVCTPIALAQEHEGNRERSGEHARDGKSRFGEVPSDFYKREWLWVDREGNYENVTKRLGKKAPKLQIGDFFENSEDKGKQLEKMNGKIVLIDFWATWCRPCIANIPHTNEMAEKYREQGVEVIAVCNTHGAEKMEATVTENNMKFPTGADLEDKTKDAFGVQWWPYYVVVDRDGKIQAAGINAEKVEEVIESLLEHQPKPKVSDKESEHKADGERGEEGGEGHEGGGAHATINDAWLEGKPEHREAMAALTGHTPPALSVSNWINSEEMSLTSLQGKVVMLDFWATWCGPCIRSIPHTNELQAKYKDDGLVIIGVCHPRGHEEMAEMVEDKGIEYPVAADGDGKTIKAFAVDSYPDYYFIDRAGKLRVADCKNGNIEDVIKALLAEGE